MKKKTIITVIASLLIVCLSIGGTWAFLTAKSTPVVNTFTVGNVAIDLSETTGQKYTVVPGTSVTKDPTATVKAGSEPCWLFVKVKKENNADTFVSWTKGDGWTELKNDASEVVLYRKAPAGASDQTFPVIKDNKISFNKVGMSSMAGIDDEKLPSLTFTAYAIQQDNFTTAEAAWAEVSKLG